MNSIKPTMELKAADVSMAYALLRIVVGINYFNHGFTRMGNIPGFMDAMVGAMEGSWMPETLVRLTAFFVSPVELIAGLLLTIGLFTRFSLVVLFVLMAILMYGVTIVQNWDAASSQLIYNIVLFILLAAAGYNRLALDNVFFKADDSKKPGNTAEEHSTQHRASRAAKYRISFFGLNR
ncbi:MAG: DoxX family protein [Cyanobacteria bacterium P01_H01_bin.58]